MIRVNRDSVIALLLLAFCGVMFAESFQIRRAMFSTLPAATWPRLLLAILFVLCVAYLVQSLRGRIQRAEIDDLLAKEGSSIWRQFLNPFVCFVAFFGFLLSLPWLGMLLGGILFIFVCLTQIGERSWRSVGIHASVAVISVSVMWAIFTFGLGVFLPEGKILSFR